MILMAGITFISCEPNEELYNELDAAKGEYKESFSYELQNSDYEMITSGALANSETKMDSLLAYSISNTLAFSNDAVAAYYIPSLLAEKFEIFKEGSEAEVTYRYIFDDSITNNNYEAIDTIFSSESNADKYIESRITILDSLNEYLEDDFLVFDYQVRVSGDTIDASDFYVFFGGIWQKQSYYELTEDDYNQMIGPDGSGPGEYGNFSSSYQHPEYLPTLLENKYPYAKNGDKYFIKYKYYAGGIRTMFTKYCFEEDWLYYANKTEKFIQNGTEWVFSPIFKFTFLKEDYQTVVDFIKNHSELNVYMDQSYDNSEYYYGATYYYDNFDMRVSKRLDNDPLNLLEGLTDDEILTEMWSRVYEAVLYVLETKYPSAQPTINGAQVYYQATIQTWEPGDYFYIITYKVTETGKFELFQEKVAL